MRACMGRLALRSAHFLMGASLRPGRSIALHHHVVPVLACGAASFLRSPRGQLLELRRYCIVTEANGLATFLRHEHNNLRAAPMALTSCSLWQVRLPRSGQHALEHQAELRLLADPELQQGSLSVTRVAFAAPRHQSAQKVVVHPGGACWHCRSSILVSAYRYFCSSCP